MAALNEEEGIAPTISELRQFLDDPRILVVDGRSSDRTVERAKDLGASVVFQDRTGKGDAIAKAVANADLSVEFVIFIDADYTYPAEYLPQMIRLLEENPCVGMVSANRFNGHLHVEAMHDLYYFGNRLLAFTHNFFNGISLRDPLTGMRVVRASILRDWAVKSKAFDVEVELNHLVERKGYGIVEVPIAYRPRVGQKKLRVSDGASILKRILVESTR